DTGRSGGGHGPYGGRGERLRRVPGCNLADLCASARRRRLAGHRHDRIHSRRVIFAIGPRARAGPRRMVGMTTYTDQERQTLRTAAFGAVYMVSSAEPGFFDMVKESFAGSKALGKSTELRDILRSGGLPPMPKGSPQEIEAGVISALGQSQQ